MLAKGLCTFANYLHVLIEVFRSNHIVRRDSCRAAIASVKPCRRFQCRLRLAPSFALLRSLIKAMVTEGATKRGKARDAEKRNLAIGEWQHASTMLRHFSMSSRERSSSSVARSMVKTENNAINAPGAQSEDRLLNTIQSLGVNELTRTSYSVLRASNMP